MKVLIENYRGFEIHFDTEEEVFTLFSDTWDKQNVKKSFASAKAFADSYIKENAEFKPFTVIKKPSHGEPKKILITGIRKDGRLTYESNGKKEQLSEYSEGDYALYNPFTHDDLFKELSIIEKELDEVRSRLDKKKDEFIGMSLKEYKKTLITP